MTLDIDKIGLESVCDFPFMSSENRPRISVNLDMDTYLGRSVSAPTAIHHRLIAFH